MWPFRVLFGRSVSVLNLIPAGLIPRGLNLEEADPTGRLLLPTGVDSAPAALNTTPGTEFEIVVGTDQTNHISCLRNTPWFFNDQSRTYFVIPSYEQVAEISTMVAVPLPDSLVLDDSVGDSRRFDDPFDTGWASWVRDAGIRPWSGDPAPTIIPLSGDTGGSAIGIGAVGGPPLTSTGSELDLATSEAVGTTPSLGRDLLEKAGVYIYRDGRTIEFRYSFQTFYHPYVCKFVGELNRGGIDGLMQRKLQLESSDEDSTIPGGSTFKNTYDPQYPVKTPYPIEDVDFDFGGAYSQYNWELFFHSVFLIADRLRLNQRFEEALRWMSFIFDPADTSSFPSPQRFWRTKPFFEKADPDYLGEGLPMLIRLLASGGDMARITIPPGADRAALELPRRYDDLLAAVKAWRQQPFKPYLVARTRTVAFQKAVVMRSLDILIAWGDQLYRRDTLESINEATQLYIMAADLLGKRPERIPPRAVPAVQTFNSLRSSVGNAELNWFSETEDFVPPAAMGSMRSEGDSPSPSLLTLYFCIPNNDKLLGYWDTVADRLFKIRHCMNIEGVERQLALFAPPIDPALLVRATAAGLDIGSVLNDVTAPPPNYRFAVLSQKATELCNEVKSLGGALLAAMEKRDAEQLQLLRAGHETNLLKLVEEVRTHQIDESKTQVEALRISRDSAIARYQHYERLLGATEPAVLAEGVSISPRPASMNLRIVDQDGVKVLDREKEELSELEFAFQHQDAASTAELTAGLLSLIPDIHVKPWWIGSSFGGTQLGQQARAVANRWSTESAASSHKANKAAKMSQLVLREVDWVYQSNAAAQEIMQVDKQILAAEIRRVIAEKELYNQRQQIEQSEEIEQTLREKFTNQELYSWMVGQVSTLYFQAYQLAFDVTKRAERAYRYELSVQDSNFILFGYWDGLKKGLMAGERLGHDLKRMEVAFLQAHRRELEITKHVSLASLDPGALITLKTTGNCSLALPEWLFDLDFPGHFNRRIKSASVTIPCVTGPYTSVNCTLTLTGNRIRYRPDGDLEIGPAGLRSIATSSAQSDSGMFELNFRDDRYLPFEGAGAVSDWKIELSGKWPTASGIVDWSSFDFESISDVILSISYTAISDASRVPRVLENISALLAATDNLALSRGFSLRYEFPTEWNALVDGSESTTMRQATFPLTLERYPYLVQRRGIAIKEAVVFIVPEPGHADSVEAVSFGPAGESATSETLENVEGVLKRAFTFTSAEPGPWDLSLGMDDSAVARDAIHDVIVVCNYNVTTA